VISDVECAAVVQDCEFLVLQNPSKLVAQDGNKNLVGKVRLRWMPVDIKISGEGRIRTILQHVPPPSIGGIRDAHVVRNHICNETHTVATDTFGKFQEIFVTPTFWVDCAVVGNIIAVQTPGASHQERRCVTVADS